MVALTKWEMFGNFANVFGSIWNGISVGLTAKDIIEGIMNPDAELQKLGDQLSGLMTSKFTAATLRDSAAAIRDSQWAATEILNFPHFGGGDETIRNESKLAIIDAAGKGLTGITSLAKVVLAGDPEPEEVDTALAALTYALGVQLKVATLLQEGDIQQGGYRQPAIQARIQAAVDVLRTAERAFVDSLDTNVSAMVSPVSTMANNLGPAGLLFGLWRLIAPQSPPVELYDFTVSTKAGVDVVAIVKSVFAGHSISKIEVRHDEELKSDVLTFQVPTTAVATIVTDGVAQTVSIASGVGLLQARGAIHNAIAAAALDKFGFGAQAENLDALIEGFGGMVGGVWWEDASGGDAFKIGTQFDDYLNGKDGDDVLQGGHGDDLLVGEDGDDLLLGGAGDDKLYGGAGDDHLYGDHGDDLMVGGLGNDTYYVDSAGDRVVEQAGEGVDHVYSTVSLTLADNVENLTLQGSSGLMGEGNALDNRITGNAGWDTLVGGAGDDTLDGRGGRNTLIGGEGADNFVFSTLSVPRSIFDIPTPDSIVDFQTGLDTIQLMGSVFSALAGGIDAGNVAFGAARDANDHIVIDRDLFGNNRVLYDADGAGDAAAIHIATLLNQRPISAYDFEII